MFWNTLWKKLSKQKMLWMDNAIVNQSKLKLTKAAVLLS